MVTALDTPEERIRGLEAGADDFLSKPFNDLALFARVRNLMRMKMMFDELRLRDMTSRELGLADLVAEPEIGEIEPGGPILLAPPSDAQGVAWAEQLRDRLNDPDHRHPFRARGAEPRAAGAARLLRGAPVAGARAATGCGWSRRCARGPRPGRRR